MHSHILQSAGSGDAANARMITILYGSQTGNILKNGLYIK
jgi:sulfite reductase (NADPH) flavoprotein alpha-component